MADQAAGLRRLISRDFVRVLALTSARPGAGVSFVTRELAAAIAALGREVCVLDAAKEEDACAPLPPALMAMWRDARGDDRGLGDALERARRGAEIVLVDVPGASRERQARIAACAPDVILLLEARQSELQDTYALMKRILSVSGKCRLHVLINRCADTEYAKRIFANLSSTSDKYLSQPIQFLGKLPHDEHLSQRLPKDMNFLETHPHSPLARMLRALAEHILLWPFPGENDMSGFARRLVAALPATPAH